MSFRILLQKSAWSCETNMSSAIDQATRLTMRGGVNSKSSCAPLRGFRRSASIQRPAITRPATEFVGRLVPALRCIVFLICAAIVCVPAGYAQIPIPNSAPPPSGQDPNAGKQGSSIKVDVNLVVLHTTVIDDRQRFAEGLKSENFRVFEDKVEQKLFVVNFNDDFYLDLDKDFTSSIPELKEALERIDSRGSTALRDAILGSLDHLKKGTKDKKVLLVVTDGEDNASRNSLEKMIREIQKTDTVIYTIGLLSQENKKEAKRARKV